jgi:hypothetical protein
MADPVKGSGSDLRLKWRGWRGSIPGAIAWKKVVGEVREIDGPDDGKGDPGVLV